MRLSTVVMTASPCYIDVNSVLWAPINILRHTAYTSGNTATGRRTPWRKWVQFSCLAITLVLATTHSLKTSYLGMLTDFTTWQFHSVTVMVHWIAPNNWLVMAFYLALKLSLLVALHLACYDIFTFQVLKLNNQAVNFTWFCADSQITNNCTRFWIDIESSCVQHTSGCSHKIRNNPVLIQRRSLWREMLHCVAQHAHALESTIKQKMFWQSRGEYSSQSLVTWLIDPYPLVSYTSNRYLTMGAIS